MAGRDIVVIGTSTGGLQVLCELVAGLPPGFPAALFVVCHVPAEFPSKLPEILSRNGSLLARHARDGEPIYPGHIYVAPPDYHLLIAEGKVQLHHGARENRHRPAIDPLFRSAARVYGRRTIGVILTGALYDGVAGLLAIRGAGGAAVVQDPRDAILPGLPAAAAAVAGADHVVPAAELAPKLIELVRSPLPARGVEVMIDPIQQTADQVQQDMQAQAHGQRNGQVSVFTCPECGGALWQVDEAELVRFRCHVGHLYQAEVLLEEQSTALEAALWTAVRTFREKSVLGRQLAANERQVAHVNQAERYEEEARLADRYGALIHEYLLRSRSVPPPEPANGPPRKG
jgi:two-component system chemotaxis response regulator CheB